MAKLFPILSEDARKKLQVDRNRRIIEYWCFGLDTYDIAQRLRRHRVSEAEVDDVVHDYLMSKRGLRS